MRAITTAIFIGSEPPSMDLVEILRVCNTCVKEIDSLASTIC